MSAEPLINYLRQLQAQGQTHVNVDDDARQLLRAFYMRAMGSPVSANPSPVVGAEPPVSSTQPAAPVTSAQEPTPEVNQKPEVGLVVSGSSPDEQLASLKHQAASWADVKSLQGLRQTMVFATGRPDAEIMLIGEAPGFDEERLGEPFAGKAGQKLDAILRAMGTDRKDVYITNVVKFRPKMPNQTTSNRKLTKEELAAWLPFVQEEIKIIQPKVIVALGGAAAQAMLGIDHPVAKMRGDFHQFEGVPLRVTYHPSYILNDESTAEKRMLWLDMLAVMELLEMPVSEKQRGYFAEHN